MLQRTLGRGVEIVTSGAPLARQVEHVLGARGLGNPAGGEGDYAFLSTGDVDAFQALGTRFLQMPLGPVEHVDLREQGGGMSPRAQRRPRRRRAPPGHDRGRLRAPRHRLGADLVRRDARDLHRVGPGVRPALDEAGKGRGWLTAEYGMLPASTGDRKQRDVSKGRPDGRTVEIQRLIGRSIRGVVDFEKLGERTVYVDCDVLQADGGTRCASITGGYVALELACRRLVGEGKLERAAAHRHGRGRLLRRRRRRAAARPRLPGGLERRGRRERRHDRRRRPRGGPGDRRAHAALARPPRRAARARRRAASRACARSRPPRPA